MRISILLLIAVIAVLTCLVLSCAQDNPGQMPQAASSELVQEQDAGDKDQIQPKEEKDKDRDKDFMDKKLEISQTDPLAGEYFVYAILEEIDLDDNLITVHQLIQDPNDVEIDPVVSLENECLIVKIEYKQGESGSKDVLEVIEEIGLEDIKIGSEIGILFTAEDRARAILSLTDPFSN